MIILTAIASLIVGFFTAVAIESHLVHKSAPQLRTRTVMLETLALLLCGFILGVIATLSVQKYLNQ